MTAINVLAEGLIIAMLVIGFLWAFQAAFDLVCLLLYWGLWLVFAPISWLGNSGLRLWRLWRLWRKRRQSIPGA